MKKGSFDKLGNLWLHHGEHGKALANLGVIEPNHEYLYKLTKNRDHDPFHLRTKFSENHVHFNAESGDCLVLAKGYTRLQHRSFDLKKQLAKSLQNYLLPSLIAPNKGKLGQAWKGKVECLTNAKQFVVSVEAGPKGLTIKDNTVQWVVPENAERKTYRILLNVSGSNGEEATLNIDLTIN